jgi:hypothetical protein
VKSATISSEDGACRPPVVWRGGRLGIISRKALMKRGDPQYVRALGDDLYQVAQFKIRIVGATYPDIVNLQYMMREGRLARFVSWLNGGAESSRLSRLHLKVENLCWRICYALTPAKAKKVATKLY